MTSADSPTRSSNMASFLIYVATVLTIVMVLFPPFASVSGTEYALILTGPPWARELSPIAQDLGLRPHIHWVALLVQLSSVWAIALGGKHFLGSGGCHV